MGRQQLLLVLAVVVAVCAFATAVDAAKKSPPPPKLPPKYQVIHPHPGGKLGKRLLVANCTDSKNKKKSCPGLVSCPAKCADECIFYCQECTAFCMCEFYPGMSCGDPRFTGADGNNFYFHGKKGQDFCIVSDANLHINAHFIGKRNPSMSRDFTWIQALGIRFADHRLYMGAQKTVKWDDDVDRLEMTFDGMPVDIPDEIDGQWQSTTVPDLTITRTSITNGVRVELRGVFDVLLKVVPITEEDSRVHNYGVTEDDSLAHFDVAFKFYDLTDEVHGVLGQTYSTKYVNKLSVSANMPIMGGAPNYVSSDIFATDCKVARFGRKAGISMVTTRAS